MKPKIILISAITAPLLLFNTSRAATICTGAACSVFDDSLPTNVIRNCSSYSDSCYSGTRIRTCNTCNSGYTRTKQTATVPTCTGSITYYDCQSDGSGGDGGDGGDTGDGEITDCAHLCDSCTTLSNRWMATLGSPGYESRTTKRCGPLTKCECVSNTEYRCAAGYYGTPYFSGTKGCTKCPGDGTSLADSNTKITDCYMTGGSDDTGTFTYTSNCYYTE